MQNLIGNDKQSLYIFLHFYIFQKPIVHVPPVLKCMLYACVQKIRKGYDAHAIIWPIDFADYLPTSHDITAICFNSMNAISR
jgi:hypothetical protein